ncbi:MAG: dihydroneopterin aldolase [Bacteroidetes bacterium]|nr:MAG: dihydroneopterin aldolase [Bacteroidota bacterium]
MKHQIHVNGIKCFANHGCLDEEGLIGGHYIVHVSLTTDFSSAAQSDKLSETIDYVTVNKIVSEEMKIRSKLIEHVGQRIVDRMRGELSTIQSLRVEIIKLSPPINGDVESVAIVIED